MRVPVDFRISEDEIEEWSQFLNDLQKRYQLPFSPEKYDLAVPAYGRTLLVELRKLYARGHSFAAWRALFQRCSEFGPSNLHSEDFEVTSSGLPYWVANHLSTAISEFLTESSTTSLFGETSECGHTSPELYRLDYRRCYRYAALIVTDLAGLIKEKRLIIANKLLCHKKLGVGGGIESLRRTRAELNKGELDLGVTTPGEFLQMLHSTWFVYKRFPFQDDLK